MFWCVLANGVDNLQQDHYCWWVSSSGYKRVDTCSLCSRVYWPSAWHTPGTSLLVLGSDHHVLIQVQGWRAAAADAGSKCQDLVSLWPNCWNLFWNMNMSAPVSVAMSEVSMSVTVSIKCQATMISMVLCPRKYFSSSTWKLFLFQVILTIRTMVSSATMSSRPLVSSLPKNYGNILKVRKGKLQQ